MKKISKKYDYPLLNNNRFIIIRIIYVIEYRIVIHAIKVFFITFFPVRKGDVNSIHIVFCRQLLQYLK